MKTRLFYGLLIAALLASAVYAALVLVFEERVQSCSDTDFGLNFTVKGNISGVDLNNSTFSYTDNCLVNNITLREGACMTNSTGVYAQVWKKDCSDLNMTCVVGRCVANDQT